MKNALIAITSMLLLISVGLGGILIYALNTKNTALDFSSGGFRNSPLVNTVKFEADNISSLDIEYSFERVEILPSTSNEIILEEYMDDHNKDMNAKTSNNNGIVSIKSGKRPKINIGFKNYYVKLYLPKDWAGDFKYKGMSGSFYCEDNWELNSFMVKQASGTIHLGSIDVENEISIKNISGSIHSDILSSKNSGIEVSGNSGSVNLGKVSSKEDISINNISASIKADEINTTGDVAIKGVSGSIKIENISAKSISIKNTTGSTQIDKSQGELDVDAGSGSVKLYDSKGYGEVKNISGSILWELSSLEGDVRVECVSGSIKLKVPQDSSFDANISALSGSIKSDFEELTLGNNKRKAEFSSGKGEKSKIDISSISGGIWLGYN